MGLSGTSRVGCLFLFVKIVFLFYPGLNKPLGHVNRETFPLPTLAPVLLDLAGELYSGRGFFVLRTIPVEKYNHEEIVIIYCGIYLHF